MAARQPADVRGHLPEPIGEHLATLAAAVPANRAIVEVGSYLGRSTCYLASGATRGLGAHVWAVDAWDLPGNPSYDRHPFATAETREAFHANLEACGVTDRVTAVQAFSVDAARDWDGPAVGLLFIDGDHSFEAVRADWRAWYPHLGDGAVVAFDDARRLKFGVHTFLEGLQAGGLSVERFHDGRFAVVRL